MNKFGNARIERYENLVSSGMTSAEVYEKLLNDFIKRNTRKSKIKKIFNND